LLADNFPAFNSQSAQQTTFASLLLSVPLMRHSKTVRARAQAESELPAAAAEMFPRLCLLN
jgi:hypothetical protein